ncbi:MAG TPA: flagellar hook-associated protein FlgL [Pseudogracilibacillus sp.]|nr:flagellar hook-associated protein FlgL [Pseudogracilibacillus sp.]
MRITQSMMQDNLLRHLFNSQAQMDKYLTQITTGKKIRRPSEDPVVAMKGISYRTEVAEVEQFRRNASEVWTWMDHSDDVLDKAGKAMQRIEELAVQAANDTYTPNERRSIQEEVKELRDQLVELANTRVNGKYIFNGTHTEKERIVEVNGEYVVNELAEPMNDVLIEVSKGIEFPANVNPDGVFDNELFEHIQNFIDKLGSDGDVDFNDNIEELNQSTLNIVNGRAKLGARMNRLELVEDRLGHQEVIAQDIMAKNEGVDFEEAVMNLLTQEVVHRAALAAGTKIIQPSLIDFLR